MSLQTTMMDATATLIRPTSVSRDAAQGVVQNFEVIDSALTCSEQQAGGGDKLLYAQRDVDITTTIYFIEDPGATVNDMLVVVSDWTQMSKTYLAVGNSKSDTHGLLWLVNCVEVVAPATPPVVTLPTSASVTDTTATLGGTVTNDGGSELTTVGIVVSESATNDYPILNGTGVSSFMIAVPATGLFTEAVTGLAPGTLHSFRPYATNALGTTYGVVIEFMTEDA